MDTLLIIFIMLIIVTAGLIITALIATIRWLIRYNAEQIAKEIRKNNGELARAIAYELAENLQWTTEKE